MSKGDGNGDGGYGGGFPFMRQVSQQVRIDESKETRELLQQFRVSILVIWGVLGIYYVATNFMFGLIDWTNVVHGTQLVASLAFFFYFRDFLYRRFDTFYLLGDRNNSGRMYLGTHTILSFLMGAALFIGLATQTTAFTVSTLRYPEGARFLPDGFPYVLRYAVITLAMAVTVPSVSLIIRLVFRELPDQFHGDIEIERRRQELELDWEKQWFEERKYEDNRTPPAISDSKALSFPIPVYAQAGTKSFPNNDARGAEALREFVEKIGSGEIDTDQDSWRGQTLSRSRVPLTVSFGNAMRNILIGSDLAQWNHPTSPNQGWKLNPLMEIDDIISHITDDFVHHSGIDMFRQA